MSRFRPLLAIAGILLSATVALAEVPKEYRSHLSQTNSLITSCEQKLKQIRHDFERGAHRNRGQQVFDRNLTDIASRLEKAKNFAKDFPNSVEELAAMTQRIAAFEADLAKLKADLAADSQQAAGENAALEAGAAKDIPAAEGVSATLYEVMTSVGSEMKTDDSIKAWAQVKADANRLITTYGSSRATSDEAKQLIRAVQKMKSDFSIAQDRVSEFLKEAPGSVDTHLSAAEKDARNALASGQFGAFTGSIRRAIQASEVLMETASLLKAGGESADTSWISGQRERIAKLHAQAKSQYAKIVGSNELPKDAYTGGDKATLAAAVTKAWLKLNPNSPPVRIIFPYSEWNRVTKWAWNEGNRSWYKQDYSTISAAVVVKSKDGKYGYWYMCYPQKDHLNGGSLSVLAMPNENAEVPADRTVLFSKVK